MARSSSPLPIRHANSLPKTPTVARHPILLDPDELGMDTVPCSPGFALRRDDTTQPTQILGRNTPTLEVSSPPSIVEVPASSSPFQPEKRPMLGSRLAPAGTVFRPPPRPQPRVPQKRPAPEPIDLISDDEDDLLPPRGDIRPTTFKAPISSFAYNPAADKEKKMREKLRQIFDVFGPKFPSAVVKQALEDNELDVPRAIDWLDNYGSQKSVKAKPAAGPAGRRLVNKASLQPTKKALAVKAPTPSPPKPAKRRLIQGLKRRGTPSPQKAQPELPEPPSSDDPLIIDLVDVDDKEDTYEAEQSPSSDDESDDRVLKCINSSTSKELAAMTGMKEALLENITAKRPFQTISQVRQVCLPKKPGARKSSKVNVGDSAVDAIEVFLDAVSAIDKVVAKCESQAKMVKGVMENWDLDTFGHNKRSGRNSPLADDLPPTPTSVTSYQYVRPPVPSQPDLMSTNCQMKPFQLFGLNWMSLLHTYGIGCILADEMGLGKTCQVISLMCHLVESYENDNSSHDARPWPNLIVVPPSTYNNWLAEFKKFAPSLSVAGYRGSQSERAEIAYEVEQDPEAYHVVLATYSQINSSTDIEAMRDCDLHAAIFDEGHKMKNPETKIYKDLRRIPSKWKMLLTGTPVQNNLLEMTSLLSFINPEIFEGHMESIRYIFSTKVSVRDVSNGAFLYSERVKRARTILEPFILQRRKDQVLSDMPQKTCTVVHCDMPKGQKPIYDEYEETFRMEPSQRAVKSKGRQNDQNNIWMQLRKAAIHPLLFRRHFTDKSVEEMGSILMDRLSQEELHQPDLKHLIQELKNSSDFELHLWCRDYPRLLKKFDYPPEAELESGKVQKLLELIDQYQKNGDRVLVFSKFSRVIEILREVLSTKDIDHRVLMGNTNVSERQTMIDEFNQDETIPVFLLTTGAGGTGINLTSANKVIIFDQSDNPQDDIQAENRAHRLGQKRDVEIIRLIARHTIEELVLKACQKKIELANKVTGAVEEVDQEAASENLEKEVRKMMEEQMTPP
ncbi:unnamed protein product [Clonostachys byssicola]|uniref:ATP-dependent helicase fft2 n=1 Tax=Clonostachys byssicola TaxID=160290 RepID=A0A9N9UT01_9HYPO|nr:unnamed protein product [Clonostachys byssicola]